MPKEVRKAVHTSKFDPTLQANLTLSLTTGSVLGALVRDLRRRSRRKGATEQAHVLGQTISQLFYRASRCLRERLQFGRAKPRRESVTVLKKPELRLLTLQTK